MLKETEAALGRATAAAERAAESAQQRATRRELQHLREEVAATVRVRELRLREEDEQRQEIVNTYASLLALWRDSKHAIVDQQAEAAWATARSAFEAQRISAVNAGHTLQRDAPECRVPSSGTAQARRRTAQSETKTTKRSIWNFGTRRDTGMHNLCSTNARANCNKVVRALAPNW